MNDLRQQLQEALKATHEIERELGGGGMSRTYVALEKALGRRVVIKILAPELLAGISVERFRREVLLAAQLQHPHVVPVLTAGDAAGLPWFTMPYVDGDSLRQHLAKGPVSITDAIGILRDVARALAYAHSHGVVHRDIKPDNVLLSAGSATVTDFGIAKAINAARTGLGGQAPALTMTGMSIGTPTYMSPEQAAGDPDTDHRADIYSFGAMAYELVAGHPPFHGRSPSKLLAAHMGERPHDLRSLRSDCPEALAAMIMQCLEKEAADRPAKATDIARVLETITSSGAATAAPSILAGGRIRLTRALSIWAGTSLAVVLTVWAAREVIGLPDWSVPGAVGVMLAGLPVILATWYVQRTVHRAYTATPQQTPGGTASVIPPQSTMATLAIKASPHLSWRRTWLGGGLAVATFAVLVVGWMVMRAAGIGPVASLRGTGAFGASERLVVADFSAPSDDPTLGVTVAEAVRTDLAQSRALNVMSRAESREVLSRMRRPDDATLTFDLAREMATREGAKAVLDGGIVRIGRNYVVTARLVNAQDGSDLATFRETAEGEDELLPALARISRAVRERAGESLRAIRRSEDVARVTTASLPALRKYVDALRASDLRSDNDEALALLEQAVAIDTAFAMAWRRIAVLLNNDDREPARAAQALERAYSHRDRLTEFERHLLEGYYFTRGPRVDLLQAKSAYEAAAQVDTTATAPLNNAGVVAGSLRQHAQAESLYTESIRRGARTAGNYTNLLFTSAFLGRPVATLDSIRRLMYERFPASEALWRADWVVARADKSFSAQDSIARAALTRVRAPSSRADAHTSVGNIAQVFGRPRDAMRAFTEARRARLATSESKLERLSSAIDSAFVLTMTMEQPAQARALLARALERYPPSTLTPIERPWEILGFVAALSQDPALARRAAAGFETDARSRANDPTAARATYDAFTALAEGRVDTALALLRQSERGLVLFEQQGWALLARAHDLTGNTDSAAHYLAKFIEVPDAFGNVDAMMYAPALTRLGEIAELRGDTATALRYYEEFVELWKNAEPEQQTKVRQIRERVARLRGTRRG